MKWTCIVHHTDGLRGKHFLLIPELLCSDSLGVAIATSRDVNGKHLLAPFLSQSLSFIPLAVLVLSGIWPWLWIRFVRCR